MNRHILSSLGLVLLCFCGCGPSDGLNRGGSLSGTVTLDGKPVGGGRVELYSADGKYSVSCQIGPNGEYKVTEPPLGTCKVVVVTTHLKGMTPPPAPKGQKVTGSGGMVYQADVGYVYTPIPAKYEKSETSDLTVDIKSGDQQHTIELTGKP